MSCRSSVKPRRSCLTSRCEGFGNVIVEALGCGTPVISVRCGNGPAEILDGGRYGVLVEPRDPQAMADAMDHVSTLRERFPAELPRRRATEFGYAAGASRYMAISNDLASGVVCGRLPDAISGEAAETG